MSAEVVYTLRPDKTPLWLPVKLASAMRLKPGALLTPEQYEDSRVQELLARRLRRKPTDPVE